MSFDKTAAAGTLANFYDVAILTPVGVTETAIELGWRVSQWALTRFSLGRETYLPHLSLYHIAVAPAVWPAFLESVRGLCADIPPFTVKLRDLFAYQPAGSIWWRAERDAAITAVAERFHHRLQPHFDRSFDAQKAWGGLLADREMQQTVEKFGTPFAGKFFDPHITITTTLRPVDADAAVRKLQVPPVVFDVRAICVCRVGPLMSCQSVVQCVPLSGPQHSASVAP